MTKELFAIDHVQLAMREGQEDAARAFYVDELGFQEVPKPAQLAARGGVWFSGGAANIHLGIDPAFIPAKKAHPALRCVEYDALLQRLLQCGLAITSDPLPFEGKEHCYINDPFGNRIEIIREAR
ncbi:MAG: glyoxalase [Candidatus Eremiobacteraeota bacterium]|nr:glyoxalase [Candidatus Eremiobacteraeota bacterium]